MNIGELRIRAIALEQELKMSALESAEIAELAKYAPLISAIQRAQAGEISQPEEIPGMHHWKFETGVFWKYPTLGDVFARFNLLLRGL